MMKERELLDIYDGNRRFTGRVMLRGEALRPGDYRLVVLVWIVNGAGELLITLRSPEKEDWANYWENTGGAVKAGETSREGCVRELFEETGIRAEPDEPELLSSHRGKSAFYDAYAIRRDISAEQVRLQPGETAAAMWVSRRKFEKMCRNGSVAAPIAAGYRRIRPALESFITRQSKSVQTCKKEETRGGF